MQYYMNNMTNSFHVNVHTVYITYIPFVLCRSPALVAKSNLFENLKESNSHLGIHKKYVL